LFALVHSENLVGNGAMGIRSVALLENSACSLKWVR